MFFKADHWLLLTLAWRSIWRHKRRTFITIFSLAFGLGLTVFLISWGNGVYHQMVDDAVRMGAGHLTLERSGYRAAPALDLAMTDLCQLRRAIEGLPGVETTKLLLSGQGVVRSARGAVGVSFVGVEPDREQGQSPLAKKIVTGSFLQATDDNRLIGGSILMKRLHLGVGKKLVLTTNDATGNLVEELYRVKGIFTVGAEEVDGYLIQAPLARLQQLFRLPVGSATQLAVLLFDPDQQAVVTKQIESLIQGRSITVYPWQEILPDLASYIQLDRGSNLVFDGILLFLLLFTLFNTLLMSVVEREHEFAVLAAIGTQWYQLKIQLFWEATFMSLLGCAAGLLWGGAAASAMEIWGLDFSRFYSEGVTVSGFAVNTKMYARLTAATLIGAGSLVFVATLLLSLLPMRRLEKIVIVTTLRG